jgi:hypothetical protein
MRFLKLSLIGVLVVLIPSISFAADSNTVVTDKTPPTASAPSIVINNSDVCKSTASAAIQTQILGFERLKLARSLYGMGMKVAGVSILCQDARVFDGMWMAGTPCPYEGMIGDDAKQAWLDNIDDVPSDSKLKKKVAAQEQ